MRKKENITVRALAILISVVLHLYAVSVFPVPADTAEDDKTYIELARLPEDMEEPPAENEEAREKEEQEQKRPLREAEKPKPESPQKNKDPKKKDPTKIVYLPYKLVDLGRPLESDPEKAPDNARFLSQRNMKTDRETVKESRARTGSPGEKLKDDKKPAKDPNPTTKDYDNKPAGKKKTDKKTSRKKTAGNEKARREAAKPETGKQTARRSSSRTRQSNPKKVSPPPVRARRSKSSAALQAPSPGKEKEKEEVQIARSKADRIKKEDLEINQYDLSKTYESDDGSVEYFSPDMARGEITSLNSKSFTYAAFYNRINKIIRFYWEPHKPLEHIQWTGTPLQTRLRIVMKDNGDLVSVSVVRASGYGMVDAAAVRAVRKAAPFYNVPKALLNEDDQFIYNLGFIIEAY